MNPIGIMQGRLWPARGARMQAFPTETWQAEFSAAAAIGIDQIEWLVTDEASGNPLLAPDGVKAINESIADSGVSVTTLCADFLISRPLLRVADTARANSLARLADVMTRSRAIGVQVIVIPILENGEIRDASELALVAQSLLPIARLAEAHGQRLAIENQLTTDEASDLLDRCASPSVGVCYDLGNAAAIGRDCASDIRQLRSSVFHVHIKDRIRDGSSVPLGAGAVDFGAAFQALSDVHYRGAMVLETPAGGDAVASARIHTAFVRHHLTPLAVARR
jgi:L-ribulose-5-phosphate 3-epimerase